MQPCNTDGNVQPEYPVQQSFHSQQRVMEEGREGKVRKQMGNKTRAILVYEREEIKK